MGRLTEGRDRVRQFTENVAPEGVLLSDSVRPGDEMCKGQADVGPAGSAAYGSLILTKQWFNPRAH